MIITCFSFVVCLCKSGSPLPILYLFIFWILKRMVFKWHYQSSLRLIPLRSDCAIFFLLFGIFGELAMIIVSKEKIGLLCRYKRWLRIIGWTISKLHKRIPDYPNRFKINPDCQTLVMLCALWMLLLLQTMITIHCSQEVQVWASILWISRQTRWTQSTSELCITRSTQW